MDNPNLNDRDILTTYNSLLQDFNNQKEGTLASEISKGIKAILILRKREKKRDYTFGEITSCISFLIGIVNEHKVFDGIGYLKWIRTFFTGDLPQSEEEIMEYISQNGM